MNDRVKYGDQSSATPQPCEVEELEGDEEGAEEAHSPLEQDSLMPSDEASDSLSRSERGHGGQEEEEEEYGSPCHTRNYREYPPHRSHAAGDHNANGHEAQDRLLQRDSQRNPRQRSRAWPRDNY